jgi:hypothetical protein
MALSPLGLIEKSGARSEGGKKPEIRRDREKTVLKSVL